MKEIPKEIQEKIEAEANWRATSGHGAVDQYTYDVAKSCLEQGYQLAPDCEYWKKRCEAAEAYAYMAFSKITGVMSGEEERLFNQWQQIKSQEPR
jgi:hypothetical protein